GVHSVPLDPAGVVLDHPNRFIDLCNHACPDNGLTISRKRREPHLASNETRRAPIVGCIVVLCRWSHCCRINLDTSYFETGAANVLDSGTNCFFKRNCLAMKLYRKNAFARTGRPIVASSGVQGIRYFFRQLYEIWHYQTEVVFIHARLS
ncbi:MAG: hypothetical protein HY735_12915, partial [Verrucomicrobia bacterium]|nr:hypothetical protein [Verrucomicrobiota bacterium]